MVLGDLGSFDLILVFWAGIRQNLVGIGSLWFFLSGWFLGIFGILVFACEFCVVVLEFGSFGCLDF